MERGRVRARERETGRELERERDSPFPFHRLDSQPRHREEEYRATAGMSISVWQREKEG